jgi:hypothetical protein
MVLGVRMIKSAELSIGDILMLSTFCTVIVKKKFIIIIISFFQIIFKPTLKSRGKIFKV